MNQLFKFLFILILFSFSGIEFLQAQGVVIRKNPADDSLIEDIVVPTGRIIEPSGDGEIIATELAGHLYPVFSITLPAGSSWTDFELKASINNFSENPMVFYYHSPDPLKAVVTSQVWTNRPKVWFTDSGASDRRVWIEQGDESISEQLEGANSVVGGFIIMITDDLSQYKDSIVFSYNLMNEATTLNDPANRSIWVPVVPSAWVKSFDPDGGE